MVRLTVLVLMCGLMSSLAPLGVNGQDVIIPTVTNGDTLVCYVVTGKKVRTKDFCGSGATSAEAEACAMSKMEAEGYVYRFGGEDTFCEEEVCQGDVSCPGIVTMARAVPAATFSVDLDCLACDGTCIQVTGVGSTWCAAYKAARATAERVNTHEGHGGIISCKVVNPCPTTNVCPKPRVAAGCLGADKRFCPLIFCRIDHLTKMKCPMFCA